MRDTGRKTKGFELVICSLTAFLAPGRLSVDNLLMQFEGRITCIRNTELYMIEEKSKSGVVFEATDLLSNFEASSPDNGVRHASSGQAQGCPTMTALAAKGIPYLASAGRRVGCSSV